MPVKTINISTRSRVQFVDITQRIAELVSNSHVNHGIAVIYSAHTTAGVTVNENADPDVVADLMNTLDRLVPRRGQYAHGEGNSDSHIKASMIGLSVTVPVENGQLMLGTWQGIYFCEFDGPRSRRVLVQLVAEKRDNPWNA